MIMNQQNPSRMPGAGLHATLTRFKSFLYNLLNGFIIDLKSKSWHKNIFQVSNFANGYVCVML